MTAEQRAPRGVDVSTPSTARMYDYFLGGKDNFAVDRETAEQLAAAAPEVRMLARENRAFLQRAVRFLAEEAGVRQFIDIGTGLPTQHNVHQVAQESASDSRVVYVDNDPIVLAHGRALLEGTDRTTVIEADMRRPDEILGNDRLRELIDFSEPVAVLFVSVLHFVTDDDDPDGFVARLREAVPSGSYLALTHATAGSRRDAQEAVRAYDQATSGITLRTDERIRSYFGDFDLVEPGLVNMLEWRCEPPSSNEQQETGVFLGGIGRKP